MRFKLVAVLICVVLITACKQEAKLSVSKEKWGNTNGQEVFLFTLKNSGGTEVKITNYGGIVTRIIVADKNGKFENVVLGLDSLGSYLNNGPYMGAIIGRFGNRIANGKFMLDTVEYTLATNNGPNHLHGGIAGFDKKVWEAKEISGNDSIGVQLTYVSKDMEEGYPGNLTTLVTYILNNNNELKIYYEAEADKATILNLTNHSYFNLNGGSDNILNHELTLYADSITPFDSTNIPTGAIVPVTGTPFDFTSSHKIGERIDQLTYGYDQNYILKRDNPGLTLAAELFEPTSGRFMQMYTTEPGMQLYTGYFLSGLTNSNGQPIDKYRGVAFEAQHYPDSPNKPHFPSVVLRPGEKYTQLTIYKFSALNK